MDKNENLHAMEDESLDNAANSELPQDEQAADAAEQEAVELTPEQQLAKQLEEVSAQYEDQKDKYLRLAAEFDNFRRRTSKEKAELIKNGGEKTITAILPIIDDMERAIDNAHKSEDVKALLEGLELIYQKFIKLLGQEGLEVMQPKGEAFDTDFHEAIALVPTPEEENKGKVLDCVQTGYKLNEKVIRHAKVVVGQ